MPRIDHKMVGEFHVLTSPDVQGLYVAHRDLEEAHKAVQPQVEALSRMSERRKREEVVKTMLADVA